MSINISRTIPNIIRRSVVQAIIFAILVAFLLSFVYAFVYHYQQKRFYIQQLGELLADSASTPDGASLVGRQVNMLLDGDPTLKSIVFYPAAHPLDNLNQTGMDSINVINSINNNWYNALFADSIGFNYAVTSRNLQDSNVAPTNANQQSTRSTLVGYINITLDIASLRWQWTRINLLSWLATIILGLFIVWYILRKLSWPTKDIVVLAEVCEMVANNPQLEQLPTIQQRFQFQEIIRIKKSFIILFERLRAAQQDYQVLADFEQQLHNKDLSLDIQRSNFQNMVTHELKTSLNAISGGLQLLDNQYLNEEQRDTLAIVNKGSQHLERTLEQIIQLNRIEKGQMAISLSEFNPLQMIAELLEEFEPIAKQKELKLISRVHHVEYMLEGDASKIKQILNTLIDNAIKFTAAGQVIIDSQLTHFDKSVRWQVKIIDTGIGIDDSHTKDIFTPFFQVDSSGTRAHEGVGIGLSVIKQIGQLLGATIDVDSELGMGSQFTVTIPLRYKNRAPNQNLLKEVDIAYYHYDDTGFIVEALKALGGRVHCQTNEQALMSYIADKKAPIVMFAEEVLPEQVVRLAQEVRTQEVSSRALLIYWYPAHKERYISGFEYDLKAAGVDYCHNAVQDSKQLASLLKKWLV